MNSWAIAYNEAVNISPCLSFNSFFSLHYFQQQVSAGKQRSGWCSYAACVLSPYWGKSLSFNVISGKYQQSASERQRETRCKVSHLSNLPNPPCPPQTRSRTLLFQRETAQTNTLSVCGARTNCQRAPTMHRCIALSLSVWLPVHLIVPPPLVMIIKQLPTHHTGGSWQGKHVHTGF